MSDTRTLAPKFTPINSKQYENAEAIEAVQALLYESTRDHALHRVPDEVLESEQFEKVMKKDGAWSAAIVRALIDVDQHMHVYNDAVERGGLRVSPDDDVSFQTYYRHRYILRDIVKRLFRRKIKLDDETLLRLLELIQTDRWEYELDHTSVVKQFDASAGKAGLGAEVSAALKKSARFLTEYQVDSKKLKLEKLIEKLTSNSGSAAYVSIGKKKNKSAKAKSDSKANKKARSGEDATSPVAWESDPEILGLMREAVYANWDSDGFYRTFERASATPACEQLLENDKEWARRVFVEVVVQMDELRSHPGKYRLGLDRNDDRDLGDDRKNIRYAYQDFFSGIINTLCKRKLSISDELLARLLAKSHGYDFKPTLLIRQAEYLVESGPLSDDLCEQLRKLHKQLPGIVDNNIAALRMRIDKVIEQSNNALAPSTESTDAPKASTTANSQPADVAITPGFAGNDGVLIDLKLQMGMIESPEEVEVETIGPDEFALRSDSPLKDAHETLTEFYEQRNAGDVQGKPIDAIPTGKAILEMQPREQIRLLLASFERLVSIQGKESSLMRYTLSSHPMIIISEFLNRSDIELSRDDMFDLMLFVSIAPQNIAELVVHVDKIEKELKGKKLTGGERFVLQSLIAMLGSTLHMFGGIYEEMLDKLCTLLMGDRGHLLRPGEHWTNLVHSDIASAPVELQKSWEGLIRYARSVPDGKVSKKWRKEASEYIDVIGEDVVHEHLRKWLAAAPKLRPANVSAEVRHAINETNANALRGLVWLSIDQPTPQLPQLLIEVMLRGLKKIPMYGPCSAKLAGGCIQAIRELAMDKDEAVRAAAVAQLARGKTRVTHKPSKKSLDLSLQKAAEKLGISQAEIEEMAVPTYDLTHVGKRVETFGEFTAELSIVSTKSTELKWIKPDGKAQQSVPKSVKDDFAEALKELKAAAKDLGKMLPAIRDRVDLFYRQKRTWAYDVWEERYLNHLLMGWFTRKLIWVFDQGGTQTSATWLDGELVDVKGKPVEIDQASAVVSLWHPIGHAQEQILAWRDFFESREIQQPFKQAHREVYLLTDAERNTSTYSNRFAAHLLKQHQFNALAALRGWRHMIQLMYEGRSGEPASIGLPEWDMRAEFWVEGLGDEVNEVGTYLYVSTDQVRFYSAESTDADSPPGVGEQLDLEDVPPLIFSEIMRDVDLFVGVASVGNDPTWQDGRSEGGQYHNYWQAYAFGDLTGTSKTRKQLLERLVPRLKIGKQCSFTDKFLVVKGELRTYKIHLGSGNILMEPNDQYLCIVPNASMLNAGEKVFLPFEGDRTLSIILSKAFLLADDAKIKDSTITSQIDRL